MIWLYPSTVKKFGVLVDRLVTFHDRLKQRKTYESKYQPEFGQIKLLCYGLAELLFSEKIEKDADVKMSTLSSGIQTQMRVLVSKKKGGSKGFNDFTTECMQICMELARFVDAYTANVGSYTNYVKEQMKMKTLSDLLQEATNELEKGLNKKVELINQLNEFIKNAIGSTGEITLATATTVAEFYAKDRNECSFKIESLGEVPIQKISPISFFMSAVKRATVYCPRLTAASVVTGTVGLSKLMLDILSNYIGPPTDHFIHADETGFDHKTLMTLLLLLAAATTESIALVKSWPKKQVQEENIQDEEKRPLLLNA